MVKYQLSLGCSMVLLVYQTCPREFAVAGPEAWNYRHGRYRYKNLYFLTQNIGDIDINIFTAVLFGLLTYFIIASKSSQ